MDRNNQTVVSEIGGFQPEREVEVGITEFVNTTNTGFSGVLKQRHVLTVSFLKVFGLGLQDLSDSFCVNY